MEKHAEIQTCLQEAAEGGEQRDGFSGNLCRDILSSLVHDNADV